MTGAQILVIDDESDIRELIKYNLEKDGYLVECFADGEQCLPLLNPKRNTSHPDLLILDLMLPGVHGLDLCRMFKSNLHTAAIPIIIISAKGEDADIVAGLELGADDYLVKPFSPRVMLARVRSVLRRSAARALLQTTTASASQPIEYGSIQIHKERHEVLVDSKPLSLTATEFHLLTLLSSNAGKVFSRTQIVESIKGDDYPVTDRSVDVQMVGLRKKLGAHGAMIETIRGIGYRCKELQT